MCTIEDFLIMFWNLKEIEINIFNGGKLKKIVHVREDLDKLQWNRDRLDPFSDVEVEYIEKSPYKLPKKYNELRIHKVNHFGSRLFDSSSILYVDLMDMDDSDKKISGTNEDNRIEGQISLEDL